MIKIARFSRELNVVKIHGKDRKSNSNCTNRRSYITNLSDKKKRRKKVLHPFSHLYITAFSPKFQTFLGFMKFSRRTPWFFSGGPGGGGQLPLKGGHHARTWTFKMDPKQVLQHPQHPRFPGPCTSGQNSKYPKYSSTYMYFDVFTLSAV